MSKDGTESYWLALIQHMQTVFRMGNLIAGVGLGRMILRFAPQSLALREVVVKAAADPAYREAGFTEFAFGDSHVAMYDGNPTRAPIHMGAVTMHAIGRDGLGRLDPRDFCSDFRVERLIFNFGEIDIRWHVFRIVDSGQPLADVIEDLVARYFKYLAIVRDLYPAASLIVAGVLPPSDFTPTPELSFHGSIAARIEATQMLNHRLACQCAEVGFAFLDVYELFRDAAGKLDPRFPSDEIHVAPRYNSMVDEALGRIARSAG
jgi:hypothetical protein